MRFYYPSIKYLVEYFAVDYAAWGWFDDKGNCLLPKEEHKKSDIPITHSTMLKPEDVSREYNITSTGKKMNKYYEFKPEFYRQGYIRWMVEHYNEDQIFLTFSPFYVNKQQIYKLFDSYEWAVISGDIEKIFGNSVPIPETASIGFVDFSKRGYGGRPFKREDSTITGLDLVIEWNKPDHLWNLIQRRIELSDSGKLPLGR